MFGGLDNQFLLRSELRRLFNWLKERGVTAVVTAEGERGSLTRHGLEEFVSDCVIFLDHRITEQLTTRRLRIVKYRGSAHETNEFPFILDNDGITVLPITSVLLDYQVSKERVTSGFASLDAMFGGQGYFRGSSVLVSGTAGTGKTTMAALFVDAACRRGERALYFAFEEPAGQIVRNLRSVGVDLQQWLDQGLLNIQAVRPTMFGLENHLTLIHRRLDTFKPDVVVLDPVTNFTAVSSQAGAKSLLVRLVDYFKRNQITSVFTSLTSGGAPAEETEVGISSLIDTWLVLRIHELDHRRQLTLTIVKSRGMPHETQSQRMTFTDEGLVLEPITPAAGKEG